jgi:rhamnulokinase
MVDLSTGTWSPLLADAAGIDVGLLPPIADAGTKVGTWRGVPVHLVGGHDTASAVVAMGAAPQPRATFVSAGTWLLVGREQPQPHIGPAAKRYTFTNEAGAMGGFRFLKNLAGAWLIEGCRARWPSQPVEALFAAAAEVDHDGPSMDHIVDVTEPRFLHPDDMLAEVTDAAGLPYDAPPPVVVRGIVESLAVSTVRVIDEMGGTPGIHVFGGGGSSLYRSRLAARAGVPVEAGPGEATALGNPLVQGNAHGVYPHHPAAPATHASHEPADPAGQEPRP